MLHDETANWDTTKTHEASNTAAHTTALPLPSLPVDIQRLVGVLNLKQAVARSNSAERIHVQPAFSRRMVSMTDRKRAVLNVEANVGISND